MKIIKRIASALFPASCYACGRRLAAGEQYVCSSCMMSFPIVAIAHDPYDNEFVKRYWGKMPMVGGTVAYSYSIDAKLSNVIYKMKYGNQPELCRMMGRLMGMSPDIAQLVKDADVLVPVPITEARRKERRYNQSELLCEGIREITGISIMADGLRRTRFEVSQTQLSRSERAENIKGCFELCQTAQLEGKHVVLVDDIVTTGATTMECLFTLSKVPGIRLSVIALAWTGGAW